MSARENFKKAAYEMFGVGDAGDAPETTSVPVGEEAGQESTGYVPRDPEPPVNSGSGGKEEYPVTVLAPGSSFEGTLLAKGDVDLACDFKGDIVSRGKVTMRTSLEGNVSGNSVELRNCTVKGNIQAEELVEISYGSVVSDGDIKTKDLICSGDVNGNVEATGHVTLSGTSKLKGDLTAGVLSIEEGALIEGNLKVAPRK